MRPALPFSWVAAAVIPIAMMFALTVSCAVLDALGVPVLCIAVLPVRLLVVHRGQLVVGPDTVPLEKHVS